MERLSQNPFPNPDVDPVPPIVNQPIIRNSPLTPLGVRQMDRAFRRLHRTIERERINGLGSDGEPRQG